jgi:Protein of unknown function (DUF3037)
MPGALEQIRRMRGGAQSHLMRWVCTSHVLRCTPNLVRDEWVNIGILLFNSATGERRLRLIEDDEEYRRVRRLHPQADEALLRAYATIWKSACKAPKHLPLPAICLPGMAAPGSGC